MIDKISQFCACVRGGTTSFLLLFCETQQCPVCWPMLFQNVYMQAPWQPQAQSALTCISTHIANILYRAGRDRSRARSVYDPRTDRMRPFAHSVGSIPHQVESSCHHRNLLPTPPRLPLRRLSICMCNQDWSELWPTRLRFDCFAYDTTQFNQ